MYILLLYIGIPWAIVYIMEINKVIICFYEVPPYDLNV